MKLNRLTADDFLSFEHVEVPFNDTLTVITGPNGVGKTTVARALSLVAQTVRACSDNDWTDVQVGYGTAGRRGAQQWRVAVEVMFEADELDFLRSWVEACVLYLIGENNDPETLRLQQFALATPDLGVAAIFGRGTFEVDFDWRRRQPWQVSWVSAVHQSDEPPLRLRLDSNVLIADGLGESRPSYQGAVRDAILGAQDQTDEPRGVLKKVPEGTYAPSVAEMARAGGVELTARRVGRDIEPGPVQRVFDALGLDLLTTQRTVGFAAVASYLLDQALLVMDNIRLPPRRVWSPNELDDRPDLATGENLPLALFQGKNGAAAGRLRFAQTQEVFAQLTGRAPVLDIVAVPAPVERGGEETVGGRELLLTPTLSDGTFDVPLHLSGAGNGEAALLAAVLASGPPVLVLDEPGTNLSSAAQRRVLTAVRDRAAAGRQTLLITHSSALVPTGIDAIVRLDSDGRRTTARRLGDDPTVRAHADILRHTPVRDALFAVGVLLTEGISDEAALRVWLATTKPTLEESGVLLLSVGSHTAFTAHMKVFDAIGVRWAALVDGPALQGPLRVYEANAPTGDFGEARAFWEERGVYTLAEEFGTGDRKKQGELEAFLEREDPDLFSRLTGSKLRKAEAFARSASTPSKVVDLWGKSLGRIGRAR